MYRVRARIDALHDLVAACRHAVVAFSGGVDSTLVAYVANRVLGGRAVVVLARTETIVEEDIALARDLASRYEFNFLELAYNELDIDQYAANPVNRCYFCKDALFARLAALAQERGIDAIFDGSNLDDAQDYRPGRQAARQHGVRSPLIESGFSKIDVRQAAKLFGLPNHDKPSAPCLSSRIPYGMLIDARSLVRIAAAERAIRGRGFVNVRVRHRGSLASVEVDRDDIWRLRQVFADVERQLRGLGYEEIVIDEEGFRSGKLNAALPRE